MMTWIVAYLVDGGEIIEHGLQFILLYSWATKD